MYALSALITRGTVIHGGAVSFQLPPQQGGAGGAASEFLGWHTKSAEPVTFQLTCICIGIDFTSQAGATELPQTAPAATDAAIGGADQLERWVAV